MKTTNVHLNERRQRLIARAAAQRALLAQEIDVWRVPLARASQALLVLRFVQRHASWLVVAVAAYTALRPTSAVRMLGRLWGAWHLVRRLRHS